MSRNETRKPDETSVTDDNAPRPWSLGGDEPEPQTIDEASKATAAQVKASRRNVDPLGRAIGPKEDPKEIKKVHDLDGEIVTPDAKTGTTPAQRKAEAAAKKKLCTERQCRSGYYCPVHGPTSRRYEDRLRLEVEKG